jgi:ABC-type multidrug transport system fused ATPase/permease subunit
MKQYKVGRYFFLAAIGFIIFVVGLALIKLSQDADGILKTLPYICVGLGSGIFGGNIGTAFKNKAMLKNPQAARQVEIEQKDERNQAISNKSKARVYDLMIFVYAAVILAFALMQVNIYVTLILVAIYLFFIFANVYYFSKYNKEM